MGWTTTKLITAGAIGVLTFLSILPGLAISYTTHVPGSSLLVGGFTGPMFVVINIFLLKKFGAATVALLVLGFVSFPFLGGNMPLLAAFVGTGIGLDAIYLLIKNETKVAAALLGSLSLLLVALFALPLYMLFIPSLAALYLLVLHILLPVMAIQGAVAGLLGRLVYFRIQKTSVVRRIQGG